jgi:biotin carboxyl carrier protein
MNPVAEQIQAEMVSNVWKIMVAVGDQVGPGDTVVILESMKMEIIQEGDLIAVINGAESLR